MKVVPLPADAKKKSYYKFINEPLIPISEADIHKYTDAPQDASQVVQFKDRNRLLQPDYQPEKDGFYLLENGGIGIVGVIDTPNITSEAADWWAVWHQLDPLRYALWNPEDHYDINITAASRRQILDPTIPNKEKLIGVDCTVLESMNGEKPTEIEINFADPVAMGYDPALIGTPSAMSMIVSNGFMKMGPRKVHVFLTEVLRQMADGSTKWISHWWIGCGIEKGQDQYQKLPMRNKIGPKAAMLVVHNHKEINHLNQILPAVYAENKDNWME